MTGEDNDEFITRYFAGEPCPECGDDEGLVEVEVGGGKTYLECKKCGGSSNEGERGEGHTYL